MEDVLTNIVMCDEFHSFADSALHFKFLIAQNLSKSIFYHFNIEASQNLKDFSN